MEETDYSVESEDEFYEDFGANLSDSELNQILIRARKTSDVELRIVVKEVQYARFLMKNLVELIGDDENELSTIQKLAKNYVASIQRANNKIL